MTFISGKIVPWGTSAPIEKAAHSEAPKENTVPNQEGGAAWKSLSAYKKFSELLARDVKQGALTPEGEKLWDGLVMSGASTPSRSSVFSFGVGGVEAKNIFFVRRTPASPDMVNIVMYMPDSNFKSFYEFKSTQEMHAFLKDLPNNPIAFSAFLAHFSDTPNSDAARSVMKSMNEWAMAPENSRPKAAMGGSSQVFGNVFERLERLDKTPLKPLFVNGLTDLQQEWISPRGFTIYSGIRPDGEKVLYKYDSTGNLTGLGDKGNYYFVEDGLRRRAPLAPLSAEQYSTALERTVLKSLEDGGLDGLVDVLRPMVPHATEQRSASKAWNYKEGASSLLKQGLAEFFENPFFWTSEFLELLGVSKEKAGFVEQTLNNPVASLLKYGNKYNDLGKRFGKTKAEMDAAFDDIGSTLQSFIPYYGPARAAGGWGAKAIKQSPATDQNLGDAANEFQNRP